VKYKNGMFQRKFQKIIFFKVKGGAKMLSLPIIDTTVERLYKIVLGVYPPPPTAENNLEKYSLPLPG